VDFVSSSKSCPACRMTTACCQIRMDGFCGPVSPTSSPCSRSAAAACALASVVGWTSSDCSASAGDLAALSAGAAAGVSAASAS